MFCGDIPLHRPEKWALYMVGTSNLGSWNGHWHHYHDIPILSLQFWSFLSLFKSKTRLRLSAQLSYFTLARRWQGNVREVFRLHVPRNPRVFCCQVNMTSLWNLDLRFCRLLWNSNLQAVSCCFLTDHHRFIVNISFIHFSVEDDSVRN